MSRLTFVTRDKFVHAACDLYGGSPHDFDGLSIEELSQKYSDVQLGEIYARLGVEL